MTVPVLASPSWYKSSLPFVPRYGCLFSLGIMFSRFALLVCIYLNTIFKHHILLASSFLSPTGAWFFSFFAAGNTSFHSYTSFHSPETKKWKGFNHFLVKFPLFDETSMQYLAVSLHNFFLIDFLPKLCGLSQTVGNSGMLWRKQKFSLPRF